MPTMLFIPGLVSDARVWKPLADGVADLVDVRHADVTRDGSIRDMAARLLKEVPGPLILAGHSMGGRVAMEMARQAPERVLGLVLANTGHNAARPDERPKRDAKIRLGHEDMAQLAHEWLPPMLAPGRDADADLVAELTEMVLGAGAEVHERQILALLGRPDAMAYLGDFDMPVLLLTGAQDGWSPEAQHREIADRLGDAELHVIEGAGHFLPVEQPEETTKSVRGWLESRMMELA